jgi:hypothetical protein
MKLAYTSKIQKSTFDEWNESEIGFTNERWNHFILRFLVSNQKHQFKWKHYSWTNKCPR